jgi:hypothetical protein
MTAYVVDDAVEHEGSSYVATDTNTNDPPSSANLSLAIPAEYGKDAGRLSGGKQRRFESFAGGKMSSPPTGSS